MLKFLNYELLIMNTEFYSSYRTCLPWGQEYFSELCEPAALDERRKELKKLKAGKARTALIQQLYSTLKRFANQNISNFLFKFFQLSNCSSVRTCQDFDSPLEPIAGRPSVSLTSRDSKPRSPKPRLGDQHLVRQLWHVSWLWHAGIYFRFWINIFNIALVFNFFAGAKGPKFRVSQGLSGKLWWRFANQIRSSGAVT